MKKSWKFNILENSVMHNPFTHVIRGLTEFFNIAANTAHGMNLPKHGTSKIVMEFITVIPEKSDIHFEGVPSPYSGKYDGKLNGMH